MALKRDGCPATALKPDEVLDARTRVGISGITRTFDLHIGPQTKKGDPKGVCQMKLQGARVRARMPDVTPIDQDAQCAACGRRCRSNSQLIP